MGDFLRSLLSTITRTGVDTILSARRSLDLIKFVWNYIKHGELDVPASIDAVDAERALDYWGFSGCVVKIPESDPAFMGKHLSYKIYRAAMDGVPKIVATVKSTLLSQLAGVAGMHLIVDNKKGAHTNQFGDYLDPLLQQYASRGIEQGTVVKRLGDALGDYTIGYTYSNVFKLLGGSENDKTSSAARNKVLTEVLALGGLDVSWENKNTIVADNGEYGMQNFDREKRWVLKIAIAHDDEDSTEGIKRRKVA